jgi:hypothetical protein
VIDPIKLTCKIRSADDMFAALNRASLDGVQIKKFMFTERTLMDLEKDEFKSNLDKVKKTFAGIPYELNHTGE